MGRNNEDLKRKTLMEDIQSELYKFAKEIYELMEQGIGTKERFEEDIINYLEELIEDNIIQDFRLMELIVYPSPIISISVMLSLGDPERLLSEYHVGAGYAKNNLISCGCSIL